MFKSVIFDMDGVIIDSQPVHFKVDSIVMENCGIKNPDLEYIKSHAGMVNTDRWGKYVKDLNIPNDINSILEMNVKYLYEVIEKEELEPIDGIIKLLDKIKSNGMNMSVASSSSHEFIDYVLNRLKIKDYFYINVSGNDVEKSKPSPDIFLLAAQKLGSSPNECIVIEDSFHGVCAANKAEIKCVGYVNKNSGPQDLSTANLIIKDFNYLADNFDKIMLQWSSEA